MLVPSNSDVDTIYIYRRCYWHLMDGITIGEKWTTVLPSKIDVDLFYSVAKIFANSRMCSALDSDLCGVRLQPSQPLNVVCLFDDKP